MTPRLSAVWAKHCLIRLELWMMFRWETATPLGVAVEPDVYCRNASESEVTSGSTHASARAAGRVSVHFHSRRASAGATVSAGSSVAAIDDVVSATAGRASIARALRRCRV